MSYVTNRFRDGQGRWQDPLAVLGGLGGCSGRLDLRNHAFQVLESLIDGE